MRNSWASKQNEILETFEFNAPKYLTAENFCLYGIEICMVAL
jgi:hypothetical protein